MGPLPYLLLWLHGANDLFESILTPLLPRLMESFSVGYGAVALLVAVYSLTANLLQPVAGMLVDRLDRRWLAALGPLLVAAGIGGMGLWPGVWLGGLVLGLAGLGSALFHAAAASLAGQYAPTGQRAGWLSIFVVGGYLGFALGPATALGLVDLGGLQALVWLVPGVALPGILLLRTIPAAPQVGLRSNWQDLPRVFRGQVLRLWAMATLQSLVFNSFFTTIPYWFDQQGLPGSRVALAFVLWSLAGAVGTYLGGLLADRWGRRRVLLTVITVAIPLYLGLVWLPPQGVAYLLLLALVGLLTSAGTPVSVTLAQEHQPQRRATVSGLMLGFTWGFSGLLYGGVGSLIEQNGVLAVLQPMVLLLLPALWLALGVREAATPPVHAGPETR